MSLNIVSEEDVFEKGKRYTRQELVDIIQKWTKEHGRSPMAAEFGDDSTLPHFVTYIRVFGSWIDALKAAGLDRKKIYKPKKYTRQILIEKIQQFEREHGRYPVHSDFDDNSELPILYHYKTEFGSYVNALKEAGFESNDTSTRGRIGELQTLSEFKTDGAIDLSGENRNNSCDGVCPKGEIFDVKSSSLIRRSASWGWYYKVTECQLVVLDYLFLRAYRNTDFSKQPLYRWRVPIEFMEGVRTVFIHKKIGRISVNHSVESMRKYEV